MARTGDCVQTSTSAAAATQAASEADAKRGRGQRPIADVEFSIPG